MFSNTFKQHGCGASLLRCAAQVAAEEIVQTLQNHCGLVLGSNSIPADNTSEMRLAWFKRERDNSDQVLYNKTLTELMARKTQPPAQHTLDEFIQIGNRDVGLADEPETLLSAKTAPEAAPLPDENPALTEPVVEEPLSELSMEELARLISDSAPDSQP